MQYYLLKMIYSDRVVRDAEKQFLVRLRDRVDNEKYAIQVRRMPEAIHWTNLWLSTLNTI